VLLPLLLCRSTQTSDWRVLQMLLLLLLQQQPMMFHRRL
jgi:hypothetical protein